MEWSSSQANTSPNPEMSIWLHLAATTSASFCQKNAKNSAIICDLTLEQEQIATGQRKRVTDGYRKCQYCWDFSEFPRFSQFTFERLQEITESSSELTLSRSCDIVCLAFYMVVTLFRLFQPTRMDIRGSATTYVPSGSLATDAVPRGFLECTHCRSRYDFCPCMLTAVRSKGQRPHRRRRFSVIRVKPCYVSVASSIAYHVLHV